MKAHRERFRVAPKIIDNKLVQESSSRARGGLQKLGVIPERTRSEIETYCWKRAMKINLCKALTLMAFSFFGVRLLQTLAAASANQAHSAIHSIRGRIFLNSATESASLKVSLSERKGNAANQQERDLGYDRAFL